MKKILILVLLLGTAQAAIAQDLSPCSTIFSRRNPLFPCLNDQGQPTTIIEYDRAKYQAMPHKPEVVDPVAHPEAFGPH